MEKHYDSIIVEHLLEIMHVFVKLVYQTVQ
jgi:hypothetical protein